MQSKCHPTEFGSKAKQMTLVPTKYIISMCWNKALAWLLKQIWNAILIKVTNSHEWYQIKQSLSIMIPVKKSCMYKGIYTFYKNLGLVWLLITHDAFHLSLAARQMYWKNKSFSWFGLGETKVCVGYFDQNGSYIGISNFYLETKHLPYFSTLK